MPRSNHICRGSHIPEMVSGLIVAWSGSLTRMVWGGSLLVEPDQTHLQSLMCGVDLNHRYRTIDLTSEVLYDDEGDLDALSVRIDIYRSRRKSGGGQEGLGIIVQILSVIGEDDTEDEGVVLGQCFIWTKCVLCTTSEPCA